MSSTPSSDEIARLEIVAHEMRESADADGYLVSKATELHPAFRRGRRTTGSLQRDLVTEAAMRGASMAGLYVETVAGGGLDLHSADQGGAHRVYRLKRIGNRRPDGTPDFICGATSTLVTFEPEEVLLMGTERWILGFGLTDDNMISEIFITPVVGHYGDNVVHLLLGRIIPIGRGLDSPPPGFVSSDEDLDFGDDDTTTGNEDEGGIGAA